MKKLGLLFVFAITFVVNLIAQQGNNVISDKLHSIKNDSDSLGTILASSEFKVIISLMGIGIAFILLFYMLSSFRLALKAQKTSSSTKMRPELFDFQGFRGNSMSSRSEVAPNFALIDHQEEHDEKNEKDRHENKYPNTSD